jgi:hypothetical protein
VNGPLQQRGNILDLDFTRANAVPDDYDTDLESLWSNLSKFSCSISNDHIFEFCICIDLFADGNDFSWETIEKGRNIFYQKQMVRNRNVDLHLPIPFEKRPT